MTKSEPDIEDWIKSAKISRYYGKTPFFKIGLVMDMGRGTFTANVVTMYTKQIVNNHLLKVTRKQMRELEELNLLLKGIACPTR